MSELNCKADNCLECPERLKCLVYWAGIFHIHGYDVTLKKGEEIVGTLEGKKDE